MNRKKGLKAGDEEEVKLKAIGESDASSSSAV